MYPEYRLAESVQCVGDVSVSGCHIWNLINGVFDLTLIAVSRQVEDNRCASDAVRQNSHVHLSGTNFQVISYQLLDESLFLRPVCWNLRDIDGEGNVHDAEI